MSKIRTQRKAKRNGVLFKQEYLIWDITLSLQILMRLKRIICMVFEIRCHRNYKVASSLKYQKQKLMSLLTHVKNNPLQNHNLGNPGLCLTGIRLYPLIKLLLKLIMKASMLDGPIPAQKYGLIPILEGYTCYQDSVSCCRGFSGTFEKRTGQEYQKSSKQIYFLLNRYGDEKRLWKLPRTGLGNI